MGRHVPSYDTPSPHHGPFTNRDPATDGGIGTQGRALLDTRLAQHPIISGFQGTIGVDGPRAHIVGETDVWSNKNTVLQSNTVIHRNIILDLNIVTNGYTSIYIDPFTDNAIAADFHTLAYLGVMPDAGAFSDLGFIRNFRTRVYTN